MKIIISISATMAFWKDAVVTHVAIPALGVVTSHVSEEAAIQAGRANAEDMLHRAYNEDKALFSQLEARGYQFVDEVDIDAEYRETRRQVREAHAVPFDTTIYLMEQTFNLNLVKR